MMQIDLAKLAITKNVTENRFEVLVEGYLAKLDYVQDKDTLVITHVGVAPELRGQGIAGKLTQVGLEYARAHALRVIPMCSYVAAYIRRNPQYLDLTKQQDDK